MITDRHVWRDLNRMPAAFRKKTTDSHIMAYKKILAATDAERKTTHRSLEDAIALAKKAPEYPFIDNKENDRYSYCTLEGRHYMGRLEARQTFINLCRQIDFTIAADIITVWYDQQWLSLKEVVKKSTVEL